MYERQVCDHSFYCDYRLVYACILVLLNAISTVYNAQLTSDVTGPFVCKKSHQVGDLFRASGAAHRRGFPATPPPLTRAAGVDPARRDGVDGDALLRNLKGKSTGEAKHAGLGGAVLGLARLATTGPVIELTLTMRP